MLSVSLSAQEFKFGVKAGLNVSGLISSNDTSDENGRLGYAIGGLAEYRMSDLFALQTEVYYSLQGTKRNDREFILYPIDEMTIELNYLNVPLLAKFYVYEGVNIYAGPQVSFLVSSSSQAIFFSEEVEYESTDIGLALGGGYEFENGLFLDARYNLGFKEVIENSEYVNFFVQLGVGYKF